MYILIIIPSKRQNPRMDGGTGALTHQANKKMSEKKKLSRGILLAFYAIKTYMKVETTLYLLRETRILQYTKDIQGDQSQLAKTIKLLLLNAISQVSGITCYLKYCI